jgi:hypothetical protein
METTMMQATINVTHTIENNHRSLVTRFLAWADDQEKNRFGWVAGILSAHGCVITPVVILLVALAGMNLVLFMIAMAAMGLCLVTNLAAMPTKVTIPAFFISLLIDLGVVAACLYHLFE